MHRRDLSVTDVLKRKVFFSFLVPYSSARRVVVSGLQGVGEVALHASSANRVTLVALLSPERSLG